MTTLEILEKLISINTIKDQENEKMLAFLESYLRPFGFQTRRVKKCLIAQNSDQPPLGFLGHTDTVSALDWEFNPFQMRKEKDHLIGLGACDMKGGIAAILGALSKIDLHKNKIALYFTYDEELGFEGIKALEEEVFPPNILIGEPTGGILVYGTKGLLELEVELVGKAAHASMPEKGDNAIVQGVLFLNKLLEYEKKLQKDKVRSFAIPYTTLNIGKILGGEAINIVASSCNLFFEFRIVKEEHLSSILTSLREMLPPNAKMVVKTKLAPKLSNQTLPFLEGKGRETVSYVTEGSFLKNDVLILGPGPITAHEKEEYITISSLEECENLYIKWIENGNNENRKS